MPSDKRDFVVNCETLLSFPDTDRDGWREKLLPQFVYSNIDPYSAAVTQWRGRPSALCTCCWGKIALLEQDRSRCGPRCPFTANWLLGAHHLVISSDWLMVKLPLVIQVSQACVPIIKTCHPEPHPSSPLNPSVRWQSSDNAPYSYFSDRTIAHWCQTENKRPTFHQDYMLKLVC